MRLPLSWLRPLLAAALAFGGRAGVVLAGQRSAAVPSRSRVAPVYAVPNLQSAAPLARLLRGMPLPADKRAAAIIADLQNASLSDGLQIRRAAPVLRHLEQTLGYSLPPGTAEGDPEKIAEGQAALALAAEEAGRELEQKSIELASRANALIQSQAGFDREKREELYGLVAQLGEIRKYYGAYGSKESREMVARIHTQALLKEGLLNGGLDVPAGAPAPAVSAQPPRRGPAGTPGAYKILADMKNNKSGWGQKDFEKLYLGFGFKLDEGAKHRKYYHPEFPQLWTAVSRQNDLPPGYAKEAVRLVTELERLRAPRESAIPSLPQAAREPANYPVAGEGEHAAPTTPPEALAATVTAMPVSPTGERPRDRSPPPKKKPVKPAAPSGAPVLEPARQRPPKAEAVLPPPEQPTKDSEPSLLNELLRAVGLKR